MLGLLLGLGIPLIYFTLFVPTWQITYKWADPHTEYRDTQQMLSWFSAIFLPISLLLLGGFYLYRACSSDSRTKRAKKKHEKILLA